MPDGNITVESSTGVVKIWEKRYDLVIKKEFEYEYSNNSLYQFICVQCSHELRYDLIVLSTFDTMNANSECTQKLNDTKTIMHRFETTAHPQVCMHNIKQKYYNCRQFQGENNSDYFNRFNSTIIVVTKHYGRLGNDKYMVKVTLLAEGYTSANLPDTITDDHKAACKKYMEHSAAIGVLLGTNRFRYLTLIVKIERGFALGSTLYYTKRSETLRVLNKYDLTK